ncbi:MAG: hypothetical protein ACREQ7_00120 [Candidatus Binatia bacterium]
MQYANNETIDTYHNWQQAQKIPINTGFFIEDLRKVELAPWDLKGGAALEQLALPVRSPQQ